MESAHSHAQHIRRARIFIQIIALVGLILSVASSVSLEFSLPSLLITIGWVLISIDGLFLARAASPTRQRSYHQHAAHLISEVARWGQLAFALCLAITGTCLPRRPAVYKDGQPVDAQYTCSAIQRYTFSWSQGLLRQARKVGRLEYTDLPFPDHSTRSKVLLERFAAFQTVGWQNPLWKAIIRDHRAAFARQWSLAVVESGFMMLPPVCLYKVLVLLEGRTSAQSAADTEVWLWVACLAISKLIHFGLDTWLQWVSFGCLATPVRAQLSALIFAKSLRLKIVDTVHEAGAKTANQEQTSSLPVSNEIEETHEGDTLLPSGGDEEPANNEEDQGNAISRGVVNLMGVDVERVADFCGYNMDLLRGVVKTIIAAGFLITLLGWMSTLAGLAVPLLLEPVNRMATKHYTSKQLAVMNARDNKSHIIEEALHGMRQIKLSASESEWGKTLLAARERELKEQRKVYVWATFLTFCWIAMPMLIGATSLSVYAWVAQKMTASVAFTALAVFSSLEFTISALPTTITEMLDAGVSAARIQEHLDSIEREDITQPGSFVEFKNADIAWPSNELAPKGFLLEGLNLTFPPGELSVICGKTGTGKSLLLAAIIGEADLVRGEIASPKSNNTTRDADQPLCNGWIVPTAVAYVGQVPWIENASVKDIVLYGLPYDRQRYAQVLHACALDQDIEMLPDGDATEVGATGVNLSGGQRWRLTFARALYSRAGILVLDDIFSAVDAHVGRHILDHGIAGDLGAGRTIILATHHVGLVGSLAAYMVNLDDGTSSRLKGKLRSARHLTPPDQPPPSVAAPNELFHHASTLVDSQPSQPRKFVQEETREHGRVKWSVYQMYIGASGGWWFWICVMSVFTSSALAVIGRSYWLALWTEAYTPKMPSPRRKEDNMPRADSSGEPSLMFYLSIYLLISMVSAMVICVKVVLVLVASLRAARHMFEKAIHNVLRAPLRWLDTEPTGRILNRLVGDFAMIDSRLGGDMMWFFNGAFSIGAIVATVLFVSLWMLIPMVVLASICLYVVALYLDGARDIKRLESSARSPIFEHVGSALSGLATIRSFRRSDDYMDRMFEHIDKHTQTSWYVLVMGQWMRFRQGALGVCFTLVIAIGVAYLPGISAAIAGFALSFALEFSSVAEETITRYASVELAMNSSERAYEYMKLDTEPATGDAAPEDWPSSGEIKVTNLEVRYAHDLEAVLKGVSFHVRPRERIGIVGRTGSGKSSLTLALFRFLEARKGAIEIDGVDISQIKLHDLRSRLAIIPQDPVLFSGTVRSNLDPFDEYLDSVLWQALQRIDPDQTTSSEASSAPDNQTERGSVFRNLDSPVSRGGSNISQGEKQLLCLARAMITRPKILDLDEATSAVDMETDALMQRSIREEFSDATLLVIAHRLSTVADFDKILVMSDGRVVEFGPPGELARQDGQFRRMIQHSGEMTLQHLLQ
ncbi:P-loop containing nucleoside triphosphate hydrolase protein [Aspergillus steynii IBT 23096]|uniref:P-loop containing nucleoside triphosphate hydrolase protein n=1 Tax=Aspergillus steynii IBT 23096 TaxID=1392250 RepID=A0A2I2GHF0_9EURO|nr:P-loop containing nucleoside triphosphate hydrolase protein [Aspergillus steynii IBT 23096]PLB52306.1 P-loop containing nucleoside triphosphate hydrolase protein [Aspergillus steynii IBT 23096]